MSADPGNSYTQSETVIGRQFSHRTKRKSKRLFNYRQRRVLRHQHLAL